MCTAVSFQSKDHYFGRNLDVECSYGEKIVVTPRKYTFNFRLEKPKENHYAIIGMAVVADSYPLYFDATNEKGLSMAGLNFPETADYEEPTEDKHNIGVFELIPWILGSCSSVDEAKDLLQKTNVVAMDFNEEYHSTPLHWMISDRDYSITVECVKEGLKIYYNPVHVLTNNPEFPMQMFNLNNYMSLSREEPETRFAEGFNFYKYSRGMGALGMPGDLSSMSRFVRGTFTRLNSVCGETESESISQFFHILASVAQTRGCVRVDDSFEITSYSSCCNTDKGVYYYKTYENSQIYAVDLHRENLDRNGLIIYNLVNEQQINYQN